MIAVRDLSFTWPGDVHPTLVISEWSVLAGEQVFLQGQSGTGKSTLLSVLAGVQDKYQGSVKVLNQEWRGLSTAQRDQFRAANIGLIFQQFNLVPYLNAVENVCLPIWFSTHRSGRLANKNTDAVTVAQELLHRLGIESRLFAKPAIQLSVGQQQRVAAARALFGKPPLILADEPTSALDQAHQERFIELLLEQAREQAASVVFVSHDDRLATHFTRHARLSDFNAAAMISDHA